MKKTLIALSLLSSMFATAQDGKKSAMADKEPMVWMADGGIVMANCTYNDGTQSVGTSSLLKLRLGGGVDYNWKQNWYIQAELMYAGNGFKYSSGGTDETISVTSLMVPINLVYKFGERGGNRFFVGGGIFYTYNMSGSESPSTGTSFNIGSDKTNDSWKGHDAGIGLLVGYQLANGMSFKADYGFGMAQIEPNTDGGASIKSKNIAVTFQYRFMKKGGSKKK